MTRILQPYLNNFFVVYLDDILIYSKTEEEHLKHIEIILEILKQNKLYANKEKCKFLQAEIEFLGNIVGDGTIKMDPSKIRTVAQWPTPSSSIKFLLEGTGDGHPKKHSCAQRWSLTSCLKGL